jgi:hypothetical protein
LFATPPPKLLPLTWLTDSDNLCVAIISSCLVHTFALLPYLYR